MYDAGTGDGQIREGSELFKPMPGAISKSLLRRPIAHGATRFTVAPGLWWVRLRRSVAHGAVRFAVALVGSSGGLYAEPGV